MPESDDAVLLKRRARRRLIGAIALVVFVVIALPIVFDKEPRPIQHDLVIQIPSQDSKFNPSAAPPASAQPAAKPPVPEPVREAAPQAPQAASAQEPSAQEPPAPKASAPARTAKPAESFMVPLGAYSNAANAKQVQSRVSAAGFKSYAENVKGPKGTQLRVRAGPFASREAAERARDKLKALGLNPVGAVAVREP